MLRILALALATVSAAPLIAGPKEIEEVQEMEARFYQAFLDRNGAAMAEIFADDFAYQHGSGTTFSAGQFVDVINSGAAIVTRADTPDLSFRDFGDVVVAYGDGPVEGTLGSEPLAINLRFVNIWKKTDGA